MGYYRASRAAFPDQRNEIHSFRHADDAVIVEFDLLGTHAGRFLGVAATGREFRCRMSAFFIFEAGTDRIEIERIYFDSGTILAQQLIGEDGVPARAPRSDWPTRRYASRAASRSAERA